MTPTPTVSRRSLMMGGAAAGLALSARAAHAVTPHAGAAKTTGHDLPRANIGAQLYSVADQASAMGFPKLFAALSAIGYSFVEFAGYSNKDGYSPKLIKRILADHGLKAIGNHGSMDAASLSGALEVGQTFTGLSVLTDVHGATKDQWKQTAADLNAYGEKCVRAGLKGFYVHMHGPEYTRPVDSPTEHVIDVLLANTDPRYVFWEMDLYWAYFFQGYLDVGGATVDPLQWVLKYPERFPLFHVKDGKQAVKRNVAGKDLQLAAEPEGGLGTFPLQDGICDVGQGDVNFKHFFHELAKVSDLRSHYYLWERDTASQHPHGSLCSARASYEMIARNRLVDPTTTW